MKAGRTLVLAVGALALVGLLAWSWPSMVSRVAYAIETGQAAAAREELAHVRDLSLAFQQVTRALMPSVVSVRSTKKLEGGPRSRLNLPPGPFWDDFFERFFGEVPQGPRGEQFVQRGIGTGVIVTKDGYILTNNHVVDGADTITVSLSDKRTFDARVVGRDDKTDLAVLKIDASDLLPAELGDSDQINVGEWVLAMGNPFGLSHTVTAGIISAKGRANVGIAEYEDFIQTDAAINPGNSGGPLINLEGKVIGINTAIATRTGGYQGIGFAIPSNMARQIMDTIIKGGRIVRGWLGVAIQNLTPDLAQSFGYEGTEGVLIGDVTKDGPADKAGLQAEDIIVRFNGKPVSDVNQLRNAVAATPPGTKVTVEVFRAGQQRTFTVEVGELESRADVARGGGAQEDLGMTIQTLTPELARQFNFDESDKGVLVTAVEPGGAAERAGLVPRDLIVAVGGRSVTSVPEFRAALARHDLSQGVRLRVKNENMQRFVILKK